MHTDIDGFRPTSTKSKNARVRRTYRVRQMSANGSGTAAPYMAANPPKAAREFTTLPGPPRYNILSIAMQTAAP